MCYSIVFYKFLWLYGSNLELNNNIDCFSIEAFEIVNVINEFLLFVNALK